ncbi:MAG: glycosyltransferase [Saprospiraceae bacterium]|nr:glycosyltransferase [Candidatus Vicinibacter affinis]
MTAASRKKVLIAPQHWGLGHVTRTIPVIRYFLNKNFEVVLASSGAGSDLLRKEFPYLTVFDIPDYGITYPSRNMFWNMTFQIFKLHKAILLEKMAIGKICKEQNIDLLVSDARLGAAQKSIPSVIISHHLHIPLGSRIIEFISDTWMRFFYMQFDQIWVPDFGGPHNLSGDLAHRFKSGKHHFIGPLSRFRFMNLPQRYDLCFVLSGPEPQRTFFEEKILSQIDGLSPRRMLLIRGTTAGVGIPQSTHLEVRDLVTSEELNEIMCASGLIVCRSGYSTLLDLSVIQKKALLIPTPGQPEQEYLGRGLMAKSLFLNVNQDDLNLSKHVLEAMAYPGYLEYQSSSGLEFYLDPLVNKLMRE